MERKYFLYALVVASFSMPTSGKEAHVEQTAPYCKMFCSMDYARYESYVMAGQGAPALVTSAPPAPPPPSLGATAPAKKSVLPPPPPPPPPPPTDAMTVPIKKKAPPVPPRTFKEDTAASSTGMKDKKKSPVASHRDELAEAIKNKSSILKSAKVSHANQKDRKDLPPTAKTDRMNLMDQIKEGIKLKKIEEPQKTSSEKNLSHLDPALVKKMTSMSAGTQGNGDDDDDDDDDW